MRASGQCSCSFHYSYDFSLRKALTPLELGVCTGGSKTPTDLYCMLLKGKELWLRGVDLNHRPLGYEPNELPGCSTPQIQYNSVFTRGQTREGERKVDINCGVSR